MTTILLLLSLAAVDILSIASPGPNILLVTQTAVEHGRTRALLAVSGIMAGSMIWAALALTGLTALFEVLPSLQTVLRIVGAAFLIYIGVKLWRKPIEQLATPDVAANGSAVKSVLRGFATSTLNPKSLTYFGTIFVLFVPAGASVDFRLAAFAIVALDGFLVYGLVAALFSTESAKAAYLRLRRPIDRVCGAIIGAFGLNLLLNR
jgi:threonine efflux protein